MEFFNIVHNAIFSWKGSGSLIEQGNSKQFDSFCQLIIAEEMLTGINWIIAIDQGVDSGTSITNSVKFLAPLVCNCFDLDLTRVKWIEVYNHDERTVDEVVIEDVIFVGEMQTQIIFTWRPCMDMDRANVELIVERAGDVVINQERTLF